MLAQIEWIGNMDSVIYILKLIFISIFTYFTSGKTVNIKADKKTVVLSIIWIICICIICTSLKSLVNFSIIILLMISSISIIFSINTKSGIGYSIVINTFAFCINYCIYFLSTILSFIVFSIHPSEPDEVCATY